MTMPGLLATRSSLFLVSLSASVPSLATCNLLLFYELYGPHPALHSFPTRRSSDLPVRARHGIVAATNQLASRVGLEVLQRGDRKSTRLNSSHEWTSYAVFCLKKNKLAAQLTARATRANWQAARVRARPRPRMHDAW